MVSPLQGRPSAAVRFCHSNALATLPSMHFLHQRVRQRHLQANSGQPANAMSSNLSAGNIESDLDGQVDDRSGMTRSWTCTIGALEAQPRLLISSSLPSVDESARHALAGSARKEIQVSSETP